MSCIIQTEHLTKYFRDVKAVDDISFSVEQGELFGFLGVNGAGKSTTISMLCTMLAPTGGSARINGYVLGKDNQQIKRSIGIVFQNSCLDRLLTVKENLMLRGMLYEKDKRRLRSNLENLSSILGMEELMGRPFGKLSGGQKRRCEIAGALMHTPDILVLDEPTTGLDPASRKRVWEIIGRLQKELGMTVFLTTHYMEEAAEANHIAIMDRGKLVSFGTPFELKEQYAKDRMVLIPKEACWQELICRIKEQKLYFEEREGRLFIPVDTTMAAIPILEGSRELIDGFEVIQGSLDDVFLNAAGGQK
ncbi:MAG: ABC transporter ATP-binding protein [Firmicutes bacterium]|nr:ABC transporter ATP-binding protein [Bacillota bacterium]